MALEAPINVLCRNVGDGSLEIAWVAAGDPVDHYDIYMSTELAGTYTKSNRAAITVTKCRIPNIPFNTTIYIRVRGVTVSGTESPMSDIGRDAFAVKATTRLLFTGLTGDVIPVSAVFAATVGDRLIAVTTTTGGTIP